MKDKIDTLGRLLERLNMNGFDNREVGLSEYHFRFYAKEIYSSLTDNGFIYIEPVNFRHLRNYYNDNIDNPLIKIKPLMNLYVHNPENFKYIFEGNNYVFLSRVFNRSFNYQSTNGIFFISAMLNSGFEFNIPKKYINEFLRGVADVILHKRYWLNSDDNISFMNNVTSKILNTDDVLEEIVNSPHDLRALSVLSPKLFKKLPASDSYAEYLLYNRVNIDNLSEVLKNIPKSRRIPLETIDSAETLFEIIRLSGKKKVKSGRIHFKLTVSDIVNNKELIPTFINEDIFYYLMDDFPEGMDENFKEISFLFKNRKNELSKHVHKFKSETILDNKNSFNMRLIDINSLDIEKHHELILYLKLTNS